jgi:hypothetical protein
MRKKRYIYAAAIRREPDAKILTQQEKEARIYAQAEKLKIKIGGKSNGHTA